MIFRAFTMVVFLLPIPIAGALAQEKPTHDKTSPEAVVRFAMAAMKEDRMSDFARTMHPGELKKLQDLMVSAAIEAENKGQAKQLLVLFPGTKSVDDLKKMSGEDFFASFFQGITRLRPEFKQVLGGSEATILGKVPEGTETMHVLCRMTMTINGIKVSKVDVISLRKEGSQWGMVLNAEFEGMAKMLKSRFGGEK